MFELFGAIFGGVFLASRVSRDKNDARETRRLIEANKRLNEDFASTTTDENLELLICKMLDDPDRYEEVWEKLKRVFSEIPAYRDLPGLLYFPKETHSCEYSMTLRILMAKEGKIPKQEAILTEGQTMFLPSQVLEHSKQMRKMFKYIMLWVEKELQKHGVPVCLVVVIAPDNDAYKQKLVPSGKELRWDEYKDPTTLGEPIDDIWGYKWRLR